MKHTITTFILRATVLALCLCLHFPLEASTESGTNPIAVVSLHSKEILDQFELGGELYEKNQFSEALEIYEKMLPACKQLQDPRQLNKLYLLIAQCKFRLSRYSESISYYNLVLSSPDVNSNFSKKVKAYNGIAAVYQKQSDYKKALDAKVAALDYARKTGKNNQIARALFQLGSFYYYLEDYSNALDYYEQSKILSEQEGEFRNAVYACQGIASSYEKLGNYNAALTLSRNAIQYAAQIRDTSLLASGHQNAGTTLHKLGNLQDALTNLNKAIILFDAIENKYHRMRTSKYIGELHQETGNIDQAINILEQGLKVAIEINAFKDQSEFFAILATIYDSNGNSNKAYNYLCQGTQIKDVVLDKDLNDKIAGIEKDFTIREKDREMQFLENETIHLNTINNIQRWSMIGLGAFLLLFISFGTFHWKRVSAKNKLLSEQNLQLAEKNRQIKIHNQEVRQFAFAASHDLKEPVRTIGSFASLLQRRHKEELSESAQEYLAFITDGAGRMQQLLDDMLTYGKIGRSNAEKEWCDTSELVDMALNNLHQNIEENQANVEIDHTNLPKLKVNKSHLVRVFQNLIGNGIKFKGEKIPSIQVACQTEPDKHVFRIVDNGIGIAPEYKKKIFNMFSRLHNRTEYEGSGIGLASCKKIIEQYGGNIWVESEIGKGSTFCFSLPKSLAS